MNKFKIIFDNVEYAVGVDNAKDKDETAILYQPLTSTAIDDGLVLEWEQFMYLNSEAALYVYRDLKGFITKIKLVEVRYIKGIITKVSTKVIYL